MDALEQAATTLAADLGRVGMQESRLYAQYEMQVAERQELLARERLARPLLDSAQNSVDSKSAELAALREHVAELEDSVKQRGDVMTDSSSLISIKKALAKIQTELQEMDLRVGMLSSELLRKSVTTQGNHEHMANQHPNWNRRGLGPLIDDDSSDEEWLPPNKAEDTSNISRKFA